MPYIDKNGKPVLWEEVYYANQYKKALIYYPVKAKTISGVIPSPTPTSSVTPTPTITPTMTPTPSAPGIDPDAAAYLADVITSGGTVNATMSAATDTLFTSLKSNSLYSKLYAMYPYLGSTAASHSINALLNKSYDITWNGGMTHGISGSTGNGTNAYADTNWSYFNWPQDDFSIGFYQTTSNTPVVTEEFITGKYDGTAFRMVVSSNNGPGNYFMRGGSASGRLRTPNGGNIDGQYITTRTGSTQADLYRNTSFIGSHVASYTKPVSPDSGPNIYFWNFNFDAPPGTPYSNGYANQTLAFSFMGEGLSSTEVSTLDGIINTFQTSLGRNTY